MTSPTPTNVRVQLTEPQLIEVPGIIPTSTLQAIYPDCTHEHVGFYEAATGEILMPLPGDEPLIAPQTYYAIDGGAYCWRCGHPVEACDRCGAHGSGALSREALHGERLRAHLKAAGYAADSTFKLAHVDDFYTGQLSICSACGLRVFSGGTDTGRRES